MRNKKGFTLVELLVTMAIIGVILGLALFGIAAAQRNARDTSRKAAVQDFNAAIQDFYTIFTSYPDTIVFDSDGTVQFFDGTAGTCTTAGSGRNCVELVVQDAAIPTTDATVSDANGSGATVMNSGTSTSSTDWCYAGRPDGYSIGVLLENDQEFYASTSTTEACF